MSSTREQKHRAARPGSLEQKYEATTSRMCSMREKTWGSEARLYERAETKDSEAEL